MLNVLELNTPLDFHPVQAITLPTSMIRWTEIEGNKKIEEIKELLDFVKTKQKEGENITVLSELYDAKNDRCMYMVKVENNGTTYLLSPNNIGSYQN